LGRERAGCSCAQANRDERILLGATGTALLWPSGRAVIVPGFVFFLALFAFNLRRGSKLRSQPAASAASGHDGAREQPLS
jgi:hypothetical protein